MKHKESPFKKFKKNQTKEQGRKREMNVESEY
jgi:hypothetical protein